jgi:hypothetical protein
MPSPKCAVSVGQMSESLKRKLLKCKRTSRMVAVTRDFHVIAARVAARLSAVLGAISYVTKAWDVRALSGLSIRHCNSLL